MQLIEQEEWNSKSNKKSKTRARGAKQQVEQEEWNNS
jgi:hypothetical protein